MLVSPNGICASNKLNSNSIDKSSSAELSESINSMWKWYRDSAFCCIYLADVYGSEENRISAFQSSRYWTRGWTLQELIAPCKLVSFYDRSWALIGARSDLLQPIHEVTRIPIEVLSGSYSVFRCSVAQRFSWAARRKTTRIEDTAYSLMGLFDINMPLLYGEGRKAFVRLQEEILRDSSDQTIFCWTDDVALSYEDIFSKKNKPELSGVLATHPRFFLHSGGLEPQSMGYMDDLQHQEITSTNLGLKLHAPTRNYGTYLAVELAVVARARSQATIARAHASWALPANHVCIIVWPEPGGKGRLMRIKHAALTLKSRLPAATYTNGDSFTHLLKSGRSTCNYNRTELRVILSGLARQRLVVGECHYAPFPVTQATIFRTLADDQSAMVSTFWEPSPDGETVLMIELHFSVEAPIILLVWLHPIIGCKCAILHDVVDKKDYARAILQTLTTGLKPFVVTAISDIGKLFLVCTRTVTRGQVVVEICDHNTVNEVAAIVHAEDI